MSTRQPLSSLTNQINQQRPTISTKQYFTKPTFFGTSTKKPIQDKLIKQKKKVLDFEVFQDNKIVIPVKVALRIRPFENKYEGTTIAYN
jgi:hypothetical protein